MKVKPESIITFIHSYYTSAIYPKSLYGLNHLQNNPHSNNNSPSNIILMPILDAIHNLAHKKTVVNIRDNICSIGQPNSLYKYAENNIIYTDNFNNIKPTDFMEIIQLAVIYAIINDYLCKMSFALVLRKKTGAKAVCFLHNCIMNYFIQSNFSVSEAKFSEISNKVKQKFSSSLLSELVENIDCSEVEKSLSFTEPKKTTAIAITSRFEDNTFSEESKFSVSKDFVLDPMFFPVCNAFVNGAKSILLYGPAGTGKSITAKLICRETGIPVCAVVNCTSNTDEFLLGKYIIQDGSPIFCESEVTRAIRNGGAVIFEEINFAKPNYLSFLNSLLDDNGFVLLDNNEYVKRHKNFRFIATMNNSYSGTKQMNEALLNRMDLMIQVPEMPVEMIKKALLDESPDCEKYLNQIIEVYNRIQALVKSGESDCAISVRNLLSWVRLAKYEDYRSAAEKTIVGSAVNSEETRIAYSDILNLFFW